MNMVHYPVFAEPFVLVVIRGALDMLQLIQPQVADIPLARAACDWNKPFTAVPELHVVGTSPLTAALALHVVRISPLTAALSTRVTMQVMQVMQLTQAKS